MMNRTKATELIRGLVSIPSLSRQEAKAATWLVQQMRDAGYARAFVDEAGNAVGEIGAEDAAQTVLLLGHIDTVAGNIEIRIVNKKGEGDEKLLYGRGSVDAKGPLATFVAAAARLGHQWALESDIRVVVVGAVEEEAATSKGARFIRDRFDGVNEPIPTACIIGEPSSWQRITLGYKGRILIEMEAQQPMAHTAGPDAGVATTAVDFWNWIDAYATHFNQKRDKAFAQLLPSLRKLYTFTDDAINEHVVAKAGIRLPLNFDVDAFMQELIGWAANRVGAAAPLSGVDLENPVLLEGPSTSITLRFSAHEPAWRSERNNHLVRSFLGAIRQVGSVIVDSATVDSSVRPSFVVKTGTSDMNVVGPAWRCPIVAYGPGDSKLDHTPHEHLNLDEYWRAVLVVEEALRKLATALR